MKTFKGACSCGAKFEPPKEQVEAMASQAVKAFGVANYDALPPGSAEAVTVGAVTGEWTMHKLTIRGDHSSLTITEVADGD